MSDALHVVQLAIPGGCGSLEGRLLYRQESSEEMGAIFCPPHPLLAGNMDNNVVRAVAKQVAETMPVLLFNYPAVGKSTSPRPGLPLFEVWNALDQSKDYRSIVEEVQRVIAWSGSYFRCYHLIGYSFGACMALAALTAESLSYTAIAPPLSEEDFSLLPALTLPICLITAEQDALLAHPGRVPSLPHLTHTTLPGADHFFRHQEEEIARRIVAFLGHEHPFPSVRSPAAPER
jgi:alpha/beta superfamily hydrolase